MITVLPDIRKMKKWLIQTKHKKLALVWVQMLMQNSMNTEDAHRLKMQRAKCTEKFIKVYCLQKHLSRCC